MKKHGFIEAYPLDCYIDENGKLTIKDGHHRLEAAKRLGIKVFYVICNHSLTITELQRTSKKWTILDYVESYARKGLGDYEAILQWQKKTKITLPQVASMLFGENADSSNASKIIHSGKFVVKDETHISHVGFVVNALVEKGFLKLATSKNFVGALSTCCFLSKDIFDPHAWAAKAIKHEQLLAVKRTKDDYLMLIEEVLNFRSAQENRVQLVFKAKELARLRNPVLKNKTLD